ncbi:MAG: biotin-dependent carboxyltransferase family protein [Rhodoferax sp.]|uniref:5-oxoprolinase subunit C family protein n=1 Tax=Rhodoferax sp. TaxID=50421 RepID=UPI00262FF69F|nr:biotin-dependent carboxyltransferase family protein [Rhodoferax sp.]MDD5334574.1 biotin-dependent carboxyltransferase family protein [Rhodoferax sp.]
MAIKVLQPGLATTVQDAGRTGYYHLGIPLSGALDQYSFRAANLLVGNAEDAATLEMTMLGPKLEFTQDASIALTGAHMPAKLDGVAIPDNQVVCVKAGSVLSFDFLKGGVRAYLAVAGGIDVPEVLGSRSTYALGAIGGFCGRKLQAGDVLAVGPAPGPVPVGRRLPEHLKQALPKQVQVRVLPGLYFHWLTEASGQTFFEDSWRVGPEADRIGYRFKHGRPLEFEARERPFGAGSDPSNIVDAGYPIGSIQVPGGLEPIILHRDAVSGGGYAMIGTVISADMDVVAQLQPNFHTQFVAVDMAQALRARVERNRRLAALRAALMP